MPWKVSSQMSQRDEFVRLAQTAAISFAQLCARFGISRRTGYKWCARFAADGAAGLADRSRAPHRQPQRTATDLEQQVCDLRAQHPAWGGRKLRARLLALGHTQVPAASTITAILRRHARLAPQQSAAHTAWQRFEHPAPNDLWQMDFKGDFAVAQGRCHPLTVLDDHSRFALVLAACANQLTATVQALLIRAFRQYGLPRRITCDNGAPWGSCGQAQSYYTVLTVWLLRLGVGVSHSRPHHPQTQGKDERFHRTLKAELLRDHVWQTWAACQPPFDAWRQVYNHQRPHEALGLAVPATRYQVSWRPYPESLPALEYGPGDAVRRVADKGRIAFQGRRCYLGNAFRGEAVALRPTTSDGVWEVRYAHFQIGTLDLRVQPTNDRVYTMCPHSCYP